VIAKGIATCLMLLVLIQASLSAQKTDSTKIANASLDSLQIPYWTVTDSTLLFSPHVNAGEILSCAPSLIYLSPGGDGQPGILLSGAGDLYGSPVYWDDLVSGSYLIPFFEASKLRWPEFHTLSLTLNHMNISENPIALNFEPIFIKQNRPFSRVSYATKDFGRDEVFALFAKQIRPGMWFQGLGGLGSYKGYTQNSAYHFQKKTFEVEKIFSSGKQLHIGYRAYLGEAGFPGREIGFGYPSHPQLKRKVGESLLQGRLIFPKAGRLRQTYLWRIRYLSEEWTNRSPFSHILNDEWGGQFQWQGAFDWGKHHIRAAPALHVNRLSYKNNRKSVFRVNASFSDRFLLFTPDWRGVIGLNIAGGNFGFSGQQIGFRVRKKRKYSPDFFINFTHQCDGLLAPVFRDSSNYHRDWFTFLPFLGQFPRQETERPRTNFREGMVLPLAVKKSVQISALISGVQWLQMPVVVKSTRKVIAGNASLWGRAAFWKYWGLAGGTNLRLMLNGRQAEILSAVPRLDSWASLSFHNLFFQNDLDATVKLFFQFLGRTEFNVPVTSQWSAFHERQPVFLLHLYGYFNVGDVRFWVGFENILDNAYFLLPGYRAPGRSFRYGLVWDFWN